MIFTKFKHCNINFFPNYMYNECTKVQNPRYKDVTLNTYTSA